MKAIHTVGTYSVVMGHDGAFYHIKNEGKYVLAPKVQYVTQGILTYSDLNRAIRDCEKLANN